MLLNLILISQWCYCGLPIFFAIALFSVEVLRSNLWDYLWRARVSAWKLKLLPNYRPKRKNLKVLFPAQCQAFHKEGANSCSLETDFKNHLSSGRCTEEYVAFLDAPALEGNHTSHKYSERIHSSILSEKGRGKDPVLWLFIAFYSGIERCLWDGLGLLCTP